MGTYSDKLLVGLGGSGHDWSTAAMQGDQLVAVAEERVTRKKYGLGVDLLAAQSRKVCLNELKATSEDISKVVVCDLVPKPFFYSLRNKTEVINHHLAHAYSAFVMSGYEQSAILVADHSGSTLEINDVRRVETVSLYKADRNEIKLLKRYTGIQSAEDQSLTEYLRSAAATTNSLGSFYRDSSLALGFSFIDKKHGGVYSEDGKTMGLSPYGDRRFVPQMKETFELLSDGEFRFNPDKLAKLLSKVNKDSRFDDRAAMAFAVQYQFEQVLKHLANYLHQLTGEKNLCIAGGCALNSVGNGLLVDESPFEKIYVPPAPSDDGIAIGCVGYALHQESGKVPTLPRSAYLGPTYTNKEIDEAIKANNLQAEISNRVNEAVAQRLADGRIIGWYQGRSEFGPRALGNRSILAAPNPGFVRDKLNHEIKRREWFRPYAPMVPIEHKDEYFNFTNDAPHMSFVAKVTDKDKIRAACHVDDTARLQTISSQDNPKMHDLLLQMGQLTGVPVLLNTSFNYAGEPIVETPQDAIHSALNMRLDSLILEDRIIDLDN
ncbi:MAG: carbamoyltransferase [Aestuariibacter sp.]